LDLRTDQFAGMADHGSASFQRLSWGNRSFIPKVNILTKHKGKKSWLIIAIMLHPIVYVGLSFWFGALTYFMFDVFRESTIHVVNILILLGMLAIGYLFTIYCYAYEAAKIHRFMSKTIALPPTSYRWPIPKDCQ